MKGMTQAALGVCILFGSPLMADDDGPLSVTTKILFGTLAPDDVQTKTIIPAILGVGLAGAGVGFKGQIANAPYLGKTLSAATLGQVDVEDAIEGLSLFTGVQGIMGLWKKGPALRRDYANSVGLILMEEQVRHPGHIGPHECRTAVVGGLAVMQGIPFLRDILPGLLGKLPTAADEL